MSLQLTPERCAAIYECLRQFPPFNRWRLPHADAIEFRTTLRTDCEAEHAAFTNGEQRIMVSIAKVRDFDDAVLAIGHEMVHVAQEVAHKRTDHGPRFQARAQAVCRAFGWTAKDF